MLNPPTAPWLQRPLPLSTLETIESYRKTSPRWLHPAQCTSTFSIFVRNTRHANRRNHFLKMACESYRWGGSHMLPNKSLGHSRELKSAQSWRRRVARSARPSPAQRSSLACSCQSMLTHRARQSEFRLRRFELPVSGLAHVAPWLRLSAPDYHPLKAPDKAPPVICPCHARVASYRVHAPRRRAPPPAGENHPHAIPPQGKPQCLLHCAGTLQTRSGRCRACEPLLR